ncbi:MAG TPA: nitroreductase family protein [Anaerolineales bacterium]|nr:nitroreductase family protein [Anaerolineales bacterium]
MNIHDAIRQKRAVRKFTGEPIPEADIIDIVNAGRLAQSSKNMQAWHFIAVTEREALRDLSECGQFAGHLAGAALGIAILTPDPDLRFNVMFDAGQAAAYMQLEAFGKGIGSCLATIYDWDRARKLLGFPQELHIRIAISFGYPLEGPSHASRRGGRRALEAVLSMQRWNPLDEPHNPFI